jgi:hypothetical protein
MSYINSSVYIFSLCSVYKFRAHTDFVPPLHRSQTKAPLHRDNRHRRNIGRPRQLQARVRQRAGRSVLLRRTWQGEERRAYPVCCVRCVLCAVCAVCGVRCAVCCIRCTVYGVLCAVCGALCTVHCVLCAVRCALCAMWLCATCWGANKPPSPLFLPCSSPSRAARWPKGSISTCTTDGR